MIEPPIQHLTGAVAARPKRLWPRRLVVGLALLSLIAFSAGFVYFVELVRSVADQTVESSDGIVALTGGAERIGDAAVLLQRGAGRRLLVSGVNERVAPEEVVRQTPALKDYLNCCVDFGYAARNTVGNALEARAWSSANRFRSLLVVTSNYHMPRALAEFAAAMPNVRLSAFPVLTERVDVSQWWLRPQTFRLLAVEYLKYLMSQARIRIEHEPGALWSARGASIPNFAARN